MRGDGYPGLRGPSIYEIMQKQFIAHFNAQQWYGKDEVDHRRFSAGIVQGLSIALDCMIQPHHYIPLGIEQDSSTMAVQCSGCGQSFDTDEELIQHIRSQHL